MVSRVSLGLLVDGVSLWSLGAPWGPSCGLLDPLGVQDAPDSSCCPLLVESAPLEALAKLLRALGHLLWFSLLRPMEPHWGLAGLLSSWGRPLTGGPCARKRKMHIAFCTHAHTEFPHNCECTQMQKLLSNTCTCACAPRRVISAQATQTQMHAHTQTHTDPVESTGKDARKSTSTAKMANDQENPTKAHWWSHVQTAQHHRWKVAGMCGQPCDMDLKTLRPGSRQSVESWSNCSTRRKNDPTAGPVFEPAKLPDNVRLLDVCEAFVL